MSALQNVMDELIKIFHKHAGDDQLLNKTELNGLLKEELGVMLKNAKDPKIADEFFKALDQDGSGTADFTEFVTMVATLTALTNEMIFQKPVKR